MDEGRECITRELKHKISGYFLQDNHIYLQLSDDQVGGYKAIHVLNYRLEDVTTVTDGYRNPICDVVFPVVFNYLNFPYITCNTFRWKHFLVHPFMHPYISDLKTTTTRKTNSIWGEIINTEISTGDKILKMVDEKRNVSKYVCIVSLDGSIQEFVYKVDLDQVEK